jgi:hypothetical protein
MAHVSSHLMVSSTPSQGSLSCNVAKKCHSAVTLKSYEIFPVLHRAADLPEM